MEQQQQRIKAKSRLQLFKPAVCSRTNKNSSISSSNSNNIKRMLLLLLPLHSVERLLSLSTRSSKNLELPKNIRLGEGFGSWGTTKTSKVSATNAIRCLASYYTLMSGVVVHLLCCKKATFSAVQYLEFTAFLWLPKIISSLDRR